MSLRLRAGTFKVVAVTARWRTGTFEWQPTSVKRRSQLGTILAGVHYVRKDQLEEARQVR